MLAEAAGGRLQTLATELEQLAACDQPVEEVVARWRGLRRDADVLREHAQANPEAAARVEQAIGALEAKEAEHQQLRTRQEHDNLRRLQQIGRQIETLLASDQISLKAGDRALREIRAALETHARRRVGDTLGLCYNPEFIALGSVVRDMLSPDLILIGESDAMAGDVLESIYH